MQEIQKSVTEMEDMLAEVVCMIWGINKETINGRIRVIWGSNVDTKSMSSPNLKTTEDICYIHVMPEDDAYNRQRHIQFVHLGGENMAAVDEHTDVHNILFVNYGNNAYDCARKIRNGLYRDDIRRFLRINRFPLVTDTPAIRRVPELVNGNWVNRVDVSAKFNQYVRLITEIGTIEQVGVTPVTDGENGNGNGENGGNGNGTNNPGEIGARGERGVFIVPNSGNIRNLNEVKKGVTRP